MVNGFQPVCLTYLIWMSSALDDFLFGFPMTSSSNAHHPTTRYFSTTVEWCGSGTSAWLRFVVFFVLVDSTTGLQRDDWDVFGPDAWRMRCNCDFLGKLRTTRTTMSTVTQPLALLYSRSSRRSPHSYFHTSSFHHAPCHHRMQRPHPPRPLIPPSLLCAGAPPASPPPSPRPHHSFLSSTPSPTPSPPSPAHPPRLQAYTAF